MKELIQSSLTRTVRSGIEVHVHLEGGIVLEGLRFVSDQPDFVVVNAVRDGHALVEAVGAVQSDAMVAGRTMPNLYGIDAIRQIRKRYPDIRILILTMHPDIGYATANWARQLRGGRLARLRRLCSARHTTMSWKHRLWRVPAEVPA